MQLSPYGEKASAVRALEAPEARELMRLLDHRMLTPASIAAMQRLFWSAVAAEWGAAIEGLFWSAVAAEWGAAIEGLRDSRTGELEAIAGMLSELVPCKDHVTLFPEEEDGQGECHRCGGWNVEPLKDGGAS